MHSAGIWRTSNRRRGGRAKPGHRHQRPSSFAPRLEALEDRRLLAVGGGGNAAPLAVGDTYTIAEDHSLVLAADAGVLANDSDPDGDVLTAVLTTPPSSGTLSLNPNGSLVYIPEENYHGTVVFGYRADDGSSQSQPASVTIQIQPVNDLPPVKDLTFATPTRTDLTEASYLTIPLSSPVQIVDDDSILGAGNWVGWDENAIWQPGEGLAQIGKPDDSVTDFFIKGASQDGSVIVGTSWDLLGPRITRWTVEEGWTTIGPGYAYGVSADGQFIVGETVAGVESIGYRWSIDTGFDFIEGPPGSSKVVARSISGDGNVVAGTFRDVSGKTQVYRWTPTSGIQVIPSAIASPSTPTSSVSADGRTLFGRIGGRAFRWTEESGVVLLDDVGEFAGARPHAISRDGSVMVGKLPTTDGVYRWFLWDEQHGMRDLFGTLAAEYGINVSPPPGDADTVISWDGKTIAGDGWILTLPRGDEDLAVASWRGIRPLALDVDGDAITGELVNAPVHGELHLEESGAFTYTPDFEYVGTDSFTYRLYDGIETTEMATVELLVEPPPNRPPSSLGESFTLDEDKALAVDGAGGVLVNDIDPDGDPMHAVLVEAPSHGTLDLQADGSFIYTPELNYFGGDQFVYQARDEKFGGNYVAVPLLIRSLDDRPVVNGNSYVARQDQTLVVSAAGGDGFVTVHSSDFNTGSSNFANTPSGERYFGAFYNQHVPFNVPIGISHTRVKVEFDLYIIGDWLGSSVYDPHSYWGLDVIGGPSLLSTSFSNQYSVTESLDPGIGRQTYPANYPDESFPAGTGATSSGTLGYYELLMQASGGSSLPLIPDWALDSVYDLSFVFEHSASELLLDMWASGLWTSSTGSAGLPNPAWGIDNLRVSVDVGAPLEPSGVLANDYDADGQAIVAILSAPPQHGNVTLNSDGSFEYVPHGGFSGPDSFSYHASDGTSFSEPATVQIYVNPDGNGLPRAIDDQYETNEDVQLDVVTDNGLLDNDVDDNLLSAFLVEPPEHGAVALAADGSFSYDPAQDYYGPDSFTYQSFDGTVYSPPATVSLWIHSMNDPPVALPDTMKVKEDTTSRGEIYNRPKSNDYDPDGDEGLTYLVVDPPQHGTVVFHPKGGVDYTPGENYSGTDQFTYRIFDGQDYSNTVAVDVVVYPVDDAPKANVDVYAVVTDELIVRPEKGVLANDLEPDADPLWATLSTPPQNGTVELHSDGSFRYRPDAGFTGTDRFYYRASDEFNSSESYALLAVRRQDIAIDLVAVDQPTDLDVLEQLPVSITSVPVGDTYYVEVWT